MPTIFLGPDQKTLGISWNQIFTGSLPIATGEFPQHVKDAVKDNPALENSFKDLKAYAAHRPLKATAIKAPQPLTGPPIKNVPGLKKK